MVNEKVAKVKEVKIINIPSSEFTKNDDLINALISKIEKLEIELNILRVEFENFKKTLTPNSAATGMNKGGLT